MAHNVGRRAARRHGYRPRHALQRKKDLSTSGLVAAVGLTLTGVLVLGSALSIRYQPDQRVAVAAPTIRPATLPRVDAAPAGASAVAPPAVASYAGTCVASWYSSSGRTGSAVATAAIGSLSLGSTIRITNLANGLSTVVRIDSRASTTGARCLNLSQSAFAAIADLGTGLINVRYETPTLNDPGR